jgi:hypothetical protein
VHHRAWLARQRFADHIAQQTLDHYRTTVDPPFRAEVVTPPSLRGISILSALTVLTEVGDFGRFRRAGEFIAFTGLVPSERSSGERRRQGSNTKTGNRFIRRILVEAGWNATCRPNLGPAFARRTAGQPAGVVAIAARAQDRLHARDWHLVGHRKRAGVAAVAVARELAGFCWAP